MSLPIFINKYFLKNNVINNKIDNGKRQRMLFGGISSPENIYFNDLWLFEYENLQFNSSLPDVSGVIYLLKNHLY